MSKDPTEWLRQADYDMETADAMFKAGRYIYSVFMCHLSIEKGLKGLYQEKLQEMPPKYHNLIYFVERLSLDPPADVYNFIAMLNKVSVPTRYPDDLQRIMQNYNEIKTRTVLNQSRKVLQWIKSEFEKLSSSLNNA